MPSHRTRVKQLVSRLIQTPQGIQMADPHIVRALIPNAWFTQKGPGIWKATYNRVKAMTPNQRGIALAMHWIPMEMVKGMELPEAFEDALRRL